MNGLTYIREKSNLSKNALAERIGVTRQTVNQWEKGTRKPDKKHMRLLSDFYGLDEKWFSELSDDAIKELNDQRMYRHLENGKEYYTFSGEDDELIEFFTCGDIGAMLDDRYVAAQRKCKEVIRKIEKTFHLDSAKVFLEDQIVTAEREAADLERYLDLMSVFSKITKDGTFLKVPLRYEMKAVLYAQMIAYGLYSLEEIQKKYAIDFYDGNVGLNASRIEELVEVLKPRWEVRKQMHIEQRYNRTHCN